MRTEQALVWEFHQKFGFPRGVLHRRGMLDRVDWFDLGFQRFRLIDEEKKELMDGWHNRDITSVADALGDLTYVVLGTAVACGIELEPLLHEIHRSNMTKDVGEFKPIKGKQFEQPQLRPLLIAQGFTIKEL